MAWAIDAEVWEEPVTTWDSLWKQRVRWAEGALRRALEHGPAMVRSDRLAIGARLDFAGYVGQLITPPLILGAIAGALRAGRTGTAAGLIAAYGGVAGALGFDALRWEATASGGSLPVGERVRRAVRVSLFGAIWLAAVPAGMWRLATRRGAVLYDKMDHDGGRHLHATASEEQPGTGPSPALVAAGAEVRSP